MSKKQDQKIKLSLEGNTLTAQAVSGVSRTFAFPAAAVSFNGKRIEAATSIRPPRKNKDGGWTAEFADKKCRFKITVTPGGPDWFFKQVELSADTVLPTPDYLEVDSQKQPAAGLKSCGYICGCSDKKDIINHKTVPGVVPGCGYPLAGDDMFTGIEHPAAFNTLVSTRKGVSHWRLRHFPVWKDGKIISYRAVTGLGKDTRKLFFDYLDTVRIPVLKSPLIAFCSFWSDVHISEKRDYIVTKDNYVSMLEGFNKLDIHPDIYTLDAGWHDRNSFLKAKKCYGGEKALIEIGEKFRASGSDLSLWVSPNGDLAMSNDFLRKHGIAVGSGPATAYQYGEFGVMMDERLQKELVKRISELASPKYGVRHFKVDWENECASTPEFAEKYPTPDHVREASIDFMIHLNRLVRKINPKMCIRNGFWASPWFLINSTHVFLPNSGDCEFASAPALSQRDAGANHRDFMYWCLFVRDHSLFPLDAFDNHEFSHTIQNPAIESPGVWSNTCVWEIMRGTSYHQFTLMPEALEDWQADILRHTFRMLRKNPSMIITGSSRMFGGSPLTGAVYGFVHLSGKNSCLIGLRNSSPLPQEYELPDEAPYYDQTYPVCRRFRAGEKVLFAPHEVKVLQGRNSRSSKLPAYQCQLFPQPDGTFKCFLPASEKPEVRKIHQIPEMQKTFFQQENKDGALELTFGIKVPWRMRDFKALFKICDPDCTSEDIQVRTSRYQWCTVSAYSIPFAELPQGLPGFGELKNPGDIPKRTARYFAGELPQGGEVFFSITINKKGIKPEDIELWVSGCEAPARHPEDTPVSLPSDMVVPMPLPSGFPRSMRLLPE